MGYFTEAVKRMFSRNTTNAASQSGARVPIVNVNGDPIGNDSLANLASVLGGPMKLFVQRITTLEAGKYIKVVAGEQSLIISGCSSGSGSIFAHVTGYQYATSRHNWKVFYQNNIKLYVSNTESGVYYIKNAGDGSFRFINLLGFGSNIPLTVEIVDSPSSEITELT